MPDTKDYEYLLTTFAGEQWKRISIQRRSGVAVPLFSIYSSKSAGIGELPDLRLLIDWCLACGMSIIQLLPLNDTGFNFRPYDAQSTFALDPMYLSLSHLIDVDIAPFRNDIKKIKKDFPVGLKKVNYAIKAAKLSLLWKIFEDTSMQDNPSFNAYVQDNSFWLEDYALFKVIKERHDEIAWEGWSEDLKHRNEEAIYSFREIYRDTIAFQKWLQWQLFEQFKKVKEYAAKKKVYLMGDLPFLVSRDSADVWSHQGYFKLMLSSGAPPDALYSSGQRWGMPPYNWENICAHNYDYVTEKLKYAQNFYDLYRIDHVVGIFRVWTLPLSEPLEHQGLYGTFDPKEDRLWEEHGRKVLSVMIQNTNMLSCAEDLGTIPDCCFKVLNELGIPGIDVQRWQRDWQNTNDFKDVSLYRKNSCSVIATHDMSGLCGWWKFEAGTIDEILFKRKCKEKQIDFESVKMRLFDAAKSMHGRLRWKKEITDKAVLLNNLGLQEFQCKDIVDLYIESYEEKSKFLKFIGAQQASEDECPPLIVKKVLEKIEESASIFSIQLLHDWLSLDSLFDIDPWELRINFPGTLSDKNWTLCLPLSLEDMLNMPVNNVIMSINKQSGRI